MTTTLEPTSNEKPENSAPYTGGQLLCELLEAVEGLENHVLFGARELDDTDVVVQVFTNLAMRIRKQAVAEGLVQSLDDDDGTSGRLTIGEALMAADKASSNTDESPPTIRDAAALLRRLVDLQDALRIVLSGQDELVGDSKRAIGRVLAPQFSRLAVDAMEWARTAQQKGLLKAGEEWSA